MSEERNREMTVDDFQGDAPSAYLFGNGAAMFFNEKGQQIIELQIYGLSGLKRFVDAYPYAPVYWSIWAGQKQHLGRDLVKNLLKYLKEDIDMRNDESSMQN